MTSAFAIALLRQDIENSKNGIPYWHDKTGIEALDLAIKALEQTSEDYISRQAVIDIINFEDKWLFDANGHNANTKIAFSGLESRVKALPSVPPKQREDSNDKP